MSENDDRTGESSGRGTGSTRVVSCELSFMVVDPAELVLQVTASRSAGTVVTGRLAVSTDRTALPTSELVGPNGTRSHVLQSPAGRLQVSYRAELRAPDAHPAPPTGPVEAADRYSSYSRLVYLRPSRYCPSDHLVGFAVAEFGTESSVQARVQAIATWIRERIGYVAGSSSVHDSAEHTLLTGVGTCRDFAHLGVALCRAVGIPARFASVYAPGLYPMDFHAVFEVLDGGRWYAYDATDLAPRPSMVRIATGRDAADAAFASVISGIATLEFLEVTATTGGDLPDDEHGSRFELA
ncbi:MAG TPA: transglutaminase family protein [Acidimicrobiales bacterium]|jgi:transglutaminase-like putative cysteine protease|nr:transglutaminase family protein [Acidimicrobiales bacterium]